MISVFLLTVCTVQGCILDDERAKLYAKVVKKGCAMRFAFAAAVFGESSEALFWLQLSRALTHLMRKLVNKPPQKALVSTTNPGLNDPANLNRITSKGKSVPVTEKRDTLVNEININMFMLLLDFPRSFIKLSLCFDCVVSSIVTCAFLLAESWWPQLDGF